MFHVKPNTNQETGVRLGVIACNNLNPDLVHTLFYGSQATNVSEEEAYAEAKAEAEADYEHLVEDADESINNSGLIEYDREREREAWFEIKGHEYDKEIFVERYLDKFNDRCCGIEEPTITGTHEGVTYQIGWLGGAPILWVFQGPTGNASSLCSPCAPNAADLDSEFVLDSEPEFTPGEGFPCYCVPRDWLDEEIA